VNALGLTLRQVGYELRAFRRNTAAAFFTFVFPLMFLVIFTLIFGNDTIDVRGGTTTGATFYVASIVAFSVINACYTNVAMNVAISRDRGQLKRLRGTPLPAWAFLSAKVLGAVVIAFILVVIVGAFGRLFYDVTLPTNTLPGAVLALAVGAASFAAIGLAVTGFITNEDAAPAVVNALILPLLFISDVFLPLERAPRWLDALGDVFPVKHLAAALHTAFSPFETGAGIDWGHLAVLAAWGVAGGLVAARTFKWEPRR
jgi:ABC-2 type transport system permease protein